MLYTKIRDIRSNIGKAIVGKDDVIVMLLTAVLADGHVLLEDVPGMGKTCLAKSFAKSVNGEFQRIQFTPDLLPSDITGINYYNQKQGEFVFKKGPIFGDIILADEINRATPRTQSSLLESMEERQVTVDGITMKLQSPFLVIATENPIETAGTFELPEAQLDRFLMKLRMGYPKKAEEGEIIDRYLVNSPLEELQAVIDTSDFEKMQQEVRLVYIHPAIKEMVLDIVEKTRNYENVITGVSPRGTLALINTIRAYAYVNEREYVVPEDVYACGAAVLAHRLVIRVARGHKTEAGIKIINNIINSIDVPTEEWRKA